MRVVFSLLISICFLQNNQASPLYHPKQEGTTINNNDKKETCIFKSLSKKEMEKKLGRKLKLKEKVALFFAKRKLRKNKGGNKHFKRIGQALLKIILFFIAILSIGVQLSLTFSQILILSLFLSPLLLLFLILSLFANKKKHVSDYPSNLG